MSSNISAESIRFALNNMKRVINRFENATDLQLMSDLFEPAQLIYMWDERYKICSMKFDHIHIRSKHGSYVNLMFYSLRCGRVGEAM